MIPPDGDAPGGNAQSELQHHHVGSLPHIPVTYITEPTPGATPTPARLTPSGRTPEMTFHHSSPRFGRPDAISDRTVSMAGAIGSFTAVIGFVVLILQGGRWTQQIEGRLDRIDDHLQTEIAARIAGDLSQVAARQQLADSLAQLRADYAELSRRLAAPTVPGRPYPK